MEEKLKQQPSDCIKVVLFGPESTGKTTLSKQLARYYNSVWVREYAREYLQDKWNNESKTCEPKDLLPIAVGQMKLENESAQKTDSVLFFLLRDQQGCAVNRPAQKPASGITSS